MKILMLSHGYPPVISGVTLVVQKVAREMVRRGHQVTVVTDSDRGGPYRDQDQGVELLRVRSVPNPFWSEGRLPLLGRPGRGTSPRRRALAAARRADLPAVQGDRS